MMDFERRLIKVEDASVPEKIRPGDIVVTARRFRGQLILTEVRAAGLPLDAVIDTGSQITIGNLALRDKLLRRNRDKFVTIPVTGVTGETVELQMAKIAELQLGPVVIRDVPMAFADVPPFKMFELSRRTGAAARHRFARNVPAGLARLPGAQGPLPAPPLRHAGRRHQHAAGNLHAHLGDWPGRV